jgi:lipopolysaccharide export system protein LptA
MFFRVLSTAVLIFSLFLSAKEPLEVVSDKFVSSEKKHIAIFEGNAKATQGKSWITAQKFIVYLNKKGGAKRYKAVGGVRFEIIRDGDGKKLKSKKDKKDPKGQKQHVKGHCNTLTYLVDEDKYIFEGDASIDDILNKRKMSAGKLILDNKNSTAKAVSRKKGPVRLIFQLDDVKDKSKKKRK